MATPLTPEQLAAYERDGFLLVEELVSPAELEGCGSGCGIHHGPALGLRCRLSRVWNG